MKNKFKALLAAFVGLFAFSAVAVGVNAADYELGSYKVTTETNENDTATWDFTGNTADKTLTKGDVNLGIIVDDTNGSVKVKVGYFDPYSSKTQGNPGAVFYVPVPSGSAGKITFEGNGDNATRYVYLNGVSTRSIQNISAKKVAENPGTYDVSEDFTASDITTNPTVNGKEYSGTYLKFVTYCTNGTSKEFKTNRILIKLTSGSFEATAQLFNVNFMDGETLLHLEEVESGKTISYTPTKWGYDLEGIYTDSSCTIDFDVNTVITEEKVLYTKWTAWDNTLFNDPNTLDLTLMGKGYSVFGVSLTKADTKLTGTNYSLLSGNTAFESRKAQVGSIGESTAVINTGGKMSKDNLKNGISLEASSAGVLTAYILSSTSGTPYALDCYNSNGLVTSSSKAGGSGVEQVTLNIPSAGTYYLGAGGSIKIYYVSFTPVVLNYQVNEEYKDSEGATVAAGSQIRFVGTINCLTADTLAAAKATLKLTLGEKAAKVDITSVYTSVAIDAELTFEAATNVYYVVFIISGLDDASLDGVTLTAQLDVTVGGTTYSSVVKSHTIA